MHILRAARNKHLEVIRTTQYYYAPINDKKKRAELRLHHVHHPGPQMCAYFPQNTFQVKAF